jgi:hypothetical protein
VWPSIRHRARRSRQTRPPEPRPLLLSSDAVVRIHSRLSGAHRNRIGDRGAYQSRICLGSAQSADPARQPRRSRFGAGHRSRCGRSNRRIRSGRSWYRGPDRDRIDRLLHCPYRNAAFARRDSSEPLHRDHMLARSDPPERVGHGPKDCWPDLDAWRSTSVGFPTIIALRRALGDQRCQSTFLRRGRCPARPLLESGR